MSEILIGACCFLSDPFRPPPKQCKPPAWSEQKHHTGGSEYRRQKTGAGRVSGRNKPAVAGGQCRKRGEDRKSVLAEAYVRWSNFLICDDHPAQFDHIRDRQSGVRIHIADRMIGAGNNQLSQLDNIGYGCQAIAVHVALLTHLHYV